MSTTVQTLTPGMALRLVARQPGGRAKTAAALLAEAERFEDDAFRQERIGLDDSRGNGNRRKAKARRRLRKAAEQRANAEVVTVAASEVERRKVATVGQALGNPVARLFHRIFEGRP